MRQAGGEAAARQQAGRLVSTTGVFGTQPLSTTTRSFPGHQAQPSSTPRDLGSFSAQHEISTPLDHDTDKNFKTGSETRLQRLPSQHHQPARTPTLSTATTAFKTRVVLHKAVHSTHKIRHACCVFFHFHDMDMAVQKLGAKGSKKGYWVYWWEHG